MFIKTKLFHSAILLGLLIITGCNSATRDIESEIKRGIEIPVNNPGEDPTTQPMLPPNNGGTIGDENATVGEIKIDAKNAYRVSVRFSDNYNEKGYFSRGEIGQIHFEITNLYSGAPANTDFIEEIILEAEERNETDGKYFQFITFDGAEGPYYSIKKEKIKATDNVALKIKDFSGTTNIIFQATIKNMPTPYELKIPLVIEKNKSSSMAIVPYEDRYENGLFIKKFVIHVVDSYGNKAKDGTNVYTGVINNPKLINQNGILDKSNSEFTLSPTDSIEANNVQISDTLITLASPQEYKPKNLGGWDIIDLMPQESKLKINTFDKDPAVEHISYIVGNEYRYDQCNDSIMNAAASSFESTEVKDGIAYAELRYVPAMVGKTVTIYANTRLNDQHIGISRVVALTGTGLQPITVSCTNDEGKNDSCTKTITFIQNDSEKFAREALIAIPVNAGDAESAEIHFPQGMKTSCNGNLNIIIDNIDENKTASYTLGVIAREY